MNDLIRQTIDAIPVWDLAAMEWAHRRHQQLTKPPGSLGRLEELAVRFVGMTGRIPPMIQRKVVITAAADHGVAAEGVSAYPSEVTGQMVANFLNGGAAINALARGSGAHVVVIDAGIAGAVPDHPELIRAGIRRGTGNMRREPAMTRSEAEAAIVFGIGLAADQADRSTDLLGSGDMGIGNTSAASAITAVLTGLPVSEVTGRGTGISADQLPHKIRVIQESIDRAQLAPSDPIGVLTEIGGLEIGVLTGLMIGAARHRIPVVIDGFISGAAALIAFGLAPNVRGYLIAGHSSVEVGHPPILEHLGLTPLLNLDLRLGEGTGAVLAFSIVEQAINVLNGMATFREAGVSGRSAPRDTAERFPKRRAGYLYALAGGIWDDPFLHADGHRYRHIVSTDLDRLTAWAIARGIPRSRIVRRDLRDFRTDRTPVAAWHIDLGGPYLEIEP